MTAVSPLKLDQHPNNFLNRISKLERQLADMKSTVLTQQAAAAAYVRREHQPVFAGWGYQNLPATLAATELTMYGSADHTSLMFARGGSVTRISIGLSEAWTAGSLTVTVYVNGVATVLSALIDGDDTQVAETSVDVGMIPFTAVQTVSVYAETSSWAPVTADLSSVIMWIALNKQ